MNKNPYLHWAKSMRFVRTPRDFFRILADAHAERQILRRGVAARLKARFNSVVPYTTEELAKAPLPWATNTSSYHSTPEILD